MGARSFEDLIVWQKAHAFVLEVYRMTKGFPKEETFGLTSQLRRAAVSIPANIAEGFRREGQADKARFYNISQSSADECRYYLILARDLEYPSSEEAVSLLDETRRSAHDLPIQNSMMRSNILAPQFSLLTSK